VASLVVQGALATLFVAGLWQAPPRPRLAPAREDTTVVYLVGPRQVAAPRPAGSREPPPPPPPAAPRPVAAAPLPADTASRDAPAPGAIAGRIVPGPAIGDGSLWVTPRPALPAAIADQLYGPPAEHRDTIALRRLRAMVDSLNDLIDEERRARTPPSWTVGGDDGPRWGIDPKWVYLGDIKIPTPALALLGSLLPQGNLLEAQRNRELAEMRRDLLDAAWRAQTYQDFKRYVQETRARRQRERDEQRRTQTPKDTTIAIP
jgi:hypothetical protein